MVARKLSCIAREVEREEKKGFDEEMNYSCGTNKQ